MFKNLDEFTLRGTPGALRDVIRSRKGRAPELLCEAVELPDFQLIGNVKQEVRDLDRHLPNPQILKPKLHALPPLRMAQRAKRMAHSAESIAQSAWRMA